MMMSELRPALIASITGPVSRRSVGCQRLLSQSRNTQPIREFIQNLAQFGAEWNAVDHPLLVDVRGSLSRQPNFIDARHGRRRFHDLPHEVDSLLDGLHVRERGDVYGHNDLASI